jgi:hypothetical protein
MWVWDRGDEFFILLSGVFELGFPCFPSDPSFASAILKGRHLLNFRSLGCGIE